MTMRPRALLPALICLALSGVASAGQVTVKEVKASSAAPEKMGVSYAAQNAIDGRVGTFWVEGEDSAGLGDWIEFQFPEDVTLSRMEIYAGNWDSRDFFVRHNRIKTLQLKFSNGSTEKIELLDKMERQSIKLKAPVKTRSVRVVLKEVYSGSTFNDTCLSEVLFFDEKPGTFVDNVKAKASSALPAEGSSTYFAPNLFDGIVDSQWCEGKKDAGVGESVVLTLPKPMVVKELRLLNGVAVTEETFQKNNRVTKLKVEAGGAPQEIDVPDKFGEFQSLPISGGKPVTTLKLTITGTAAGSAFNDTCISELQVIAGP